MSKQKLFKKSNCVERHSKTRLRALAVILAAYQILHMETNELVEKRQDSNAKDIPVDLPPKEEAELEKAIRDIELIAVSILKANKITTKDEIFFIDTTTLIINAFFETGILAIGVSPHLAFCMFLFIYFADGSSKKHELLFAPLTNADIFDNVFDRIERSRVLDWGKHNECVAHALRKGVGFTCTTSEKKIFIARKALIPRKLKPNKSPNDTIRDLVADGNNQQLKIKEYSIPNNKKESP